MLPQGEEGQTGEGVVVNCLLWVLGLEEAVGVLFPGTTAQGSTSPPPPPQGGGTTAVGLWESGRDQVAGSRRWDPLEEDF